MKMSFQTSKKWIAVSIGLGFLAFNQPNVGDNIELSQWLSGRSSGFFRTIDNNRIKSLPPGTKGTIKKVKLFSQTKNYGLCLDIPNENSSGDCVWVYYNKAEPRMILIKEKSSTNPHPVIVKDVAQADTAKTTDVVNGVTDQASTAPEEAQDDSALKTALKSVDNLNSEAGKILDPTPVCKDCAAKLMSYASCSAANSYQESAVENILSSAKYSGIFQGQQQEIIKKSCIQRALETSSVDNRYYRRCDEGDVWPRSSVGRACTSENYVELMSKSFNTVANCLGDFVSGSKTTKSEASLMLFSLLSLESGMNTNAVSGSGAGGTGQMTMGAIKAVNAFLPSIRGYLLSSGNPQCSQDLVKVLENPMSPLRSKLCERISLHKDNPLKNLIYTFGLQSLTRKFVDTEFNRQGFSQVFSDSLPALEKERLLSSLAAWAHNTGTGGLLVPLRVLLIRHIRDGKKISTAEDVTQFLKDLAPIMQSNPHKLNASKRRKSETSDFFADINRRMNKITSEPTSCLAQ